MRDDDSGRRQIVDEIVAGSSKIDVVDEMRDGTTARAPSGSEIASTQGPMPPEMRRCTFEAVRAGKSVAHRASKAIGHFLIFSIFWRVWRVWQTHCNLLYLREGRQSARRLTGQTGGQSLTSLTRSNRSDWFDQVVSDNTGAARDVPPDPLE